MKPEAEWRDALAAPLPKDEIKLRLGRVTPSGQKTPYSDGTRGVFLAYHDARHVMERLDEVCGPERWQDSYRVLDEKKYAVECSLSLFVAGQWITKTDVGYPNNPRDPEDEALKSAFSDALKRAGVKWGIGRYLYALPDSGWWPVNKYGELSAENEAKVRGKMFDGLAVEAPAEEETKAAVPVPVTHAPGGDVKQDPDPGQTAEDDLKAKQEADGPPVWKGDAAKPCSSGMKAAIRGTVKNIGLSDTAAYTMLRGVTKRGDATVDSLNKGEAQAVVDYLNKLVADTALAQAAELRKTADELTPEKVAADLGAEIIGGEVCGGIEPPEHE